MKYAIFVCSNMKPGWTYDFKDSQYRSYRYEPGKTYRVTDEEIEMVNKDYYGQREKRQLIEVDMRSFTSAKNDEIKKLNKDIEELISKNAGMRVLYEKLDKEYKDLMLTHERAMQDKRPFIVGGDHVITFTSHVGWVKCADRMPERDQFVLIYVPYAFETFQCPTNAFYGGISAASYVKDINDATHKSDRAFFYFKPYKKAPNDTMDAIDVSAVRCWLPIPSLDLPQ